jgi:hypothetical protein
MFNKVKEKQFKKNLQLLYHTIDKQSNLLWSHENHITGSRTKRNKHSKETSSWFYKDTTQIGYGEISMGAMIGLFNLFQNISQLISFYIQNNSLSEKKLKYEINDYNIRKDSLFLDIGSGFGKPIFHCAYQVGCKSLGIEVVPARTEFSLDFYYEYLDGKKFFQNDNDDNEDMNLIGGMLNEKNYKHIDSNGNNFSSIKIFNKKITLDLEKVNICYDDYNSLFINNKYINKEYKDLIFDTLKGNNGLYLEQNDISYNELSVNQSLYKDNMFLSYLQSQYFSHNNSILSPDDHNIRINKKFTFYTRLTFTSNQKISSLVSTIISNNLTLFITNDITNYTPFPLDYYYPDNISLLNLLVYVNNFLTTIPKNNENIFNLIHLNISIEQKENYYSNISLPLKSLELNDIITNIMKSLQCCEYDPLFYKNIKFINQDATSNRCFTFINDHGEIEGHFTHIYSYNKLMSDVCRKKISKVLNNTNWKVLAWYSNELQTKKSGLKKYFFVAKFPMNSTSTEKFYCYVYIKLK